MVKIVVGFGWGSEGPTIGIRTTDTWGGEKHRNPYGKQYARQRRFDRAYAAAEQLPEYDEPPTRRRPPKPKLKVVPRDPNVWKDSDYDKVLRGKGESPNLPKIVLKRMWSVYGILYRWLEYGYDTSQEKKGRWDYPDRPAASNPPVRRPRPGNVIPKEWEPPPKTLDEVQKYVIKEIGKVRVGSVVLGDEGVIWDPAALPGAVRVPTGKIYPRVETRGVPKGKVIVIEPVPETAPRPVPRPRVEPQVDPLPEPVPAAQPKPLPRPLPAPAPQPWMNPWLQGIAAGALAILPWGVLPNVRMQTVYSLDEAPSLNFRVRPVPRPWLRDARLRQDVKEKSNLKYLAVAKFVDRYWGKASNIAEVGEVILASTHSSDGRHPYGYRRWDQWQKDVWAGRAEVHYDEVIIGLVMNEIEDHTIAWVNKKKLESLARAGNDELDKELRAMNQIYTRMAGEGARL